jgi:hypothetical protein
MSKRVEFEFFTTENDGISENKGIKAKHNKLNKKSKLGASYPIQVLFCKFFNSR